MPLRKSATLPRSEAQRKQQLARAGCRWHRPPAPLSLNRDDVHVWRVPLDAPQDVVADLAALLSAGEQARARQMGCDEGLRRFVVSHGALRTILGRYLDQEPEHVRLVTHAGGKPRLAAPADVSTICFSLSHSDEFALCAVTKDRDVGVDVEHVRPLSVWREIAARYFSLYEREALRDVPPARALETFFRYWTCKEAYSKALGQGVSRRWTQFSVFPVPGAAVEPSRDGMTVEGDGRFTLCPLEPGPGYIAAVAARGTDWYLCCWHLHVE